MKPQGHLFVRVLLMWIPALVIALLWQSVVWTSPRLVFFIGSPVEIGREAVLLFKSGTLIRDIAVTSFETILGFLLGSSLGTIAGLSLWSSPLAYSVARPYLIALGSVPAFALGPILIFWFGTGLATKVILGVLATFVVSTVQAYTGATEADPHLIRLTRAFGGSKATEFFKIVMPSSAIWVLAGIRLNIGMSLLGAFVGEFLSSTVGLGHMIIVAEGLYNVSQIWVGVLGIIAIATTFHIVTLPIEAWALRWKRI